MSTSMKRAIALMLAGVVAVGLGVGLGFILDSDPSHLDELGETPSGPGPSDEVNGVPVGYARTEEGAVAAASNFALLAARDDLFDIQGLEAAMEIVSAPAWVEEGRQQARRGFNFIVNRYGDDANLTSAVLGFDIGSFSPERATIDLWTVTAVAGSKQAHPDQVWATLTVELRWQDDWRVAGSDSTSGPTPIALPGEEADSRIGRFEELHGDTTP